MNSTLALAAFVFAPMLRQHQDVLVAPTDAAPRTTASSERTLVVYDVIDLIEDGSTAPADEGRGSGPLLGGFFSKGGASKSSIPTVGSLGSNSTGSPDDAREARPNSARAETLALGQFMLRAMRPAVPVESVQVQAVSGGMLLLNAPVEVHDRFRAFLDTQRMGTVRVEFTTHFVEGNLDEIRRLGVHADVNPRVLDLPLEELLRAFKSGGFDLLSSPRLVVDPPRRASIATLTELPYVKDWSILRVQPGPKDLAVPEIDILHEGERMHVRAAVVGKDEIALELALERFRIQKPIRTQKATLPIDGGVEVEIALPEQEVTRISTDCALTSGKIAAYLVPRDPARPAADRELLVLVTARLVELSEAELRAREDARR